MILVKLKEKICHQTEVLAETIVKTEESAKDQIPYK